MKAILITSAIAAFALSFFLGLTGCTTSDFRLKITPMKIEINSPNEPKGPSVPTPVVPSLK